jgi:hypothetical protein
MRPPLPTPGGVGSGPPPRASFFGARSLSLVLADFGTLLCFVLVFMFVLSFLFCCSVYDQLSLV